MSKNNLVIISLSLFIVLNVGCTLIPEYEKPVAPIPNQWKMKITKDAGKKVTQMSWEDFFAIPELKNLIQIGLNNNRNFRVAALNIEDAQQRYRIQRSNLLPTINATGSYTKQKVAGAAVRSTHGFVFKQYSANLVTTAFEIDLFGRLRSLNEAALQDYFSTIEAKNSTQILLISEIANAYLTILADKQQYKLSTQTVEAQKKSYDIIAKRVDVGIDTKLALQQAETLLQRAEVDKAALDRIIEQDYNALELLLGTTLSRNEIRASFRDAEKFIAKINSGMTSEILQNRPDIRQAEHNLKAMNANIGAARAAFFPTVSLTASGGRATPEFNRLFDGVSGVWAFSPQVTLPIFTAGRNWASLQSTKVQKEIAIARYEQTIQTAFREVSDLLAARETMDAELSAQIKLADATQGYETLANARYERGIDNYLVVLDASRNAYTAEQGVISKRLARVSNYVNLYKALGGGHDVEVALNETDGENWYF